MDARSDQREPPSMATIDAPRAPVDAPRWRLTRKQWLGLPILAAITLLALLGVFGERVITRTAATPSLGVSVRYPERFRYRQTERMQIAVTNRSARTIDSVLVSLDTAYLSRFTDVHVEPEPSRAYDVRLEHVAPGETRLVLVEMSGDAYWRHAGSLGVAMGEERALVHLSSLVFP